MTIKPAQVLPERAARMLREAAATPLPYPESLDRRIAVDKAIERVRREFPQYFKTERNYVEDTGGGK